MPTCAYFQRLAACKEIPVESTGEILTSTLLSKLQLMQKLCGCADGAYANPNIQPFERTPQPPLVGLVSTPSPAPQLIQLPFSSFVIPNATGASRLSPPQSTLPICSSGCPI